MIKELTSGLVEVLASLTGNDAFDRRGSTHFHTSDDELSVLDYCPSLSVSTVLGYTATGTAAC